MRGGHCAKMHKTGTYHWAESTDRRSSQIRYGLVRGKYYRTLLFMGCTMAQANKIAANSFKLRYDKLFQARIKERSLGAT